VNGNEPRFYHYTNWNNSNEVLSLTARGRRTHKSPKNVRRSDLVYANYRFKVKNPNFKSKNARKIHEKSYAIINLLRLCCDPVQKQIWYIYWYTLYAVHPCCYRKYYETRLKITEFRSKMDVFDRKFVDFYHKRAHLDHKWANFDKNEQILVTNAWISIKNDRILIKNDSILIEIEPDVVTNERTIIKNA